MNSLYFCSITLLNLPLFYLCICNSHLAFIYKSINKITTAIIKNIILVSYYLQKFRHWQFFYFFDYRTILFMVWWCYCYNKLWLHRIAYMIDNQNLNNIPIILLYYIKYNNNNFMIWSFPNLIYVFGVTVYCAQVKILLLYLCVCTLLKLCYQRNIFSKINNLIICLNYV